MSGYSAFNERQLASYQERATARAMAVGAWHPIARLVAWLNRVVSRPAAPTGPDYRDYKYFK